MVYTKCVMADNQINLMLFFDAYKECALWSSTDSDGEYLGHKYSYDQDDVASTTLEKMLADCKRFITVCRAAQYELKDFNDMLDEQGYSQAGHDFWLTRNSHGAGFWDGDWPIYGQELTRIAKTFGTYDLYIGDDGKVHGQ